MAKGDYRFFVEGGEKDPIIHLLMSEAQKQGNLGPEQLEKIAYDSGVSISTLYAWWWGDTKRPHHLTVKFVAEALGCKLQLVRDTGEVVRGPRS